jgi:murein DD-endopeptidase MepM/ murein hydrolase activator NlpD
MKGWHRILVVTAGVAIGAAALVVTSGAVDRAPPDLAVTLLQSGPVASQLTFAVTVRDVAPGVRGWSASIDGQPADVTLDGGQAVVSLDGLSDGPHTLQVAAWDGAWSPNFSRVERPFAVDATPPELSVAARSTQAVQGRALSVLLAANEPIEAPEGELFGAPLTFHLLDEVGLYWRALVGVPLDAEPGTTSLSVTGADPAGNRTLGALDIEVAPGNYRRGGTIKLRPDQVAARNDEAAKARMRKERDAAYAWPHAAQLWRGPMLRPVERGRISSPFGKYRTYSDGKKSHHTGTDIAAPTGTPVLAANAGEVRFAGEQAIFGKVVIVHHGQGLSTSYNHLSRVDVAVGQRLTRGEPVGAVGTTGQSTGPHLHWGVIVGDVPVDGMPLLDDGLEPDEDTAWVAVGGG